MSLSNKSDTKKPIKCYFSELERSKIEKFAAAENKPISCWIRETVLHKEIKKSRAVFSNAVEAASRRYSGIPRTQMEAIVSSVIISIYDSTQSEN